MDHMGCLSFTFKKKTKRKTRILPNTLNTTSPQKITVTSNIISYTQLEVIDMTQVGQGSAGID